LRLAKLGRQGYGRIRKWVVRRIIQREEKQLAKRKKETTKKRKQKEGIPLKEDEGEERIKKLAAN
jgi:hypothetical protein